MPALYKSLFGFLAVLSLVNASGCMPFKQARVAAVAFTLEDVANAAAKQSDVAIVREGSPAYLMLISGLIEAYPENKDLLIAGSRAYTSYASSFMTGEDEEELEAIYRKAKLYGFRSLSGRADFAEAASGSLDDFGEVLRRYGKKDVPALFWTANAWAGLVSIRPDSVESLADIPALEATVRRIIELDESFYYGGPHLLMAVFLAAKPAIMGGNPAESLRHFERAFALGSDQLLMSKVLFADYYARSIGDRELFVKTLEEVIEAPVDNVPELTLANVVAKNKAKKLLDETEESFVEQP